MGNGDGLVSRRMLDFLFLIQIVVNIVVLALLGGLQYDATQTLADVQMRQVQQAQVVQADALCNQREMLVAIRKIGLKLGLPVEDIRLPDVEGLDCAGR